MFPAASSRPELGELGVLGMNLEGYGCPGRSAVEYGLAAHRARSRRLRHPHFVSVQGSLAMGAIHRWGSEDQKQEWLPRMAAGEVIGSFGLTEPEAGCDPAAMKHLRPPRRRDGDDWVLNGAKRWIGLASIAQLTVVWAQTDDGVRGFIVPTGTPGFTATPIEPKLSMRASIQATSTSTTCGCRHRPPARRAGAARALLLPQRGAVRNRLGCDGRGPRQLRGGAALCAGARVQFDRPIAGFQLTQQKLVEHGGRDAEGRAARAAPGPPQGRRHARPEQISLGKLNNVREAIAIAREARTILGGNGIMLAHSPIRHAANLESVRTYEGTDEVHTLILGQHLTGSGRLPLAARETVISRQCLAQTLP